ncbi:MAG: prolyl oligopeptidase family serine peptidase [Saprospiraceae bacterium]|nr:prolyl oligopeptidase family serine peptidase [Saprospiraceae bacterium]
MKNLIFAGLLLVVLTAFVQPDIQKTLDDINARFKNVEVSLVHWPDDLQPKLGMLKKSAFMALPRSASTEKLPLLITLHGAGGKNWTLAEQLVRSAKVKGLSLAELAGKELMAIEPNSSGDWDPLTLNIMLDYLLDQYPQIDPDRVYVMGHSMGGRGTWEWILHAPQRFAAAAPCGFSELNLDDDVSKLVDLPVWGMVGANDGKNVASIKKMIELLRKTGNPNVQYTAFPDANHAKGNASVFSSVKCIEWMLTFSKDE